MRARILDVRGSGRTLLYVPGIDGSGELLLGCADRLAPHFRLARLHYEGETAESYAELAASVMRCADELDCARPLLLAESFGVGLALHIALEHRERVAGMALVNGFAFYRNRLGLALTRGVFALAPQAWIRAGRKRFVQRGLFAPRRDEAALQALLGLRGDWFASGYRARLALIRRLDLRSRLGEVRCPVTLFAADHDRVVDSWRCAREMAESLPDAELVRLPAAGHVVLPLAEEPWPERLLALAARAERTAHEPGET